MEMQAEAENIKRRALCRVKKTSGAKSCWRNEEQQDCDSVEQQSSVQDPDAHAQPKQKRIQEINNGSERLQQIRS